MPLNLNDTIYQDEEIIINDTHLKITMNIPMKMMMEFQELQNVNENDKEAFEKTQKFLDVFLCIKNDAEVVKKFIDDLTLIQFTKVMEFIGAYINTCMETSKKKTETE